MSTPKRERKPPKRMLDQEELTPTSKKKKQQICTTGQGTTSLPLVVSSMGDVVLETSINSGTSSPIPAASVSPAAGTSSPALSESTTLDPTPATEADAQPTKVTPIFKDPNFVHSSKGSAASKKTRLWKTLKQIVSTERSLPWKPDDVAYGNIDAPPSFTPGKKYSDITGLPALYTDPHTKIRYATTEEYARIRILPSDIVSGYLALRKAIGPV